MERLSRARIAFLTTALSVIFLPPATAAPRKIIVDEDASGPGGTNQMAIMLLLQSPGAQVLGITMVTGDAWEPEEAAHTLRMLELLHRTDVPVLPGAVFPLVRTELETGIERMTQGPQPWYGAWGDITAKTSNYGYHVPEVIPPLPEGAPSTHAAEEDAAHFLVRQVRAYPHQVWIYAGGPLTNIALALSIDPHFAELSAGIVLMGGSLAPRGDDPEFLAHPRHEFNFWFDPEAAHIVLRARWPQVDLTPVDVSVQVSFTPQMLAEIAKSPQPAAQYIAKYSHDFSYMWDELAAAAWIEPSLITREIPLYIDVNLNRGTTYGDTLSWTEAEKPITPPRPAHVQIEVDTKRFYRMFIERMQAASNVPAARQEQEKVDGSGPKSTP